MAIVLMAVGCNHENRSSGNKEDEREKHRPQFHFSPKKGWMNDPNGMVYLNGKYHLFFQHNPDSNVWGPMHWGHAISTDLVHWKEQPVALFPDSLGTIFSGSAVVDSANTAGFGASALVAIFTHHNIHIEQEKTGKHEYQSLAFSTDEGRTWKKYEGNPVLPNPGIVDFRDPKVMWHEESKQWIMTLATKQTITFYASPNLREWHRLSEFGKDIGAHGGVWECPDLFQLKSEAGEKWILLVSINPGAPNGGSGTQYFVGEFDGTRFQADHTDIRWMDYGPEDYAGVTFSNTGERKVLVGWMNNWEYANEIPASTWRGAATFARELKLIKLGKDFFLSSDLVSELDALYTRGGDEMAISVDGSYDLSEKMRDFKGQYMLELKTEEVRDFSLHLKNEKGEEVIIGFDASKNHYYVDRSKSGNVTFKENFILNAIVPRIGKEAPSLKLLVDVTSVEVFADGGLSVLTALFFPNEVLDGLEIRAHKGLRIKELNYGKIASVF